MLLRFRVANFASLRDEQELSLIAFDRHDDTAARPVPGADGSVLPVAGVFGANASGKSNLLQALLYARDAVVDSHRKWSPAGPIPRVAFQLDQGFERKPSRFVTDLVVGGVRYEYGFVLDDVRIREEWLYSFPERRRRKLFERNDDEFTFGPSLGGVKRRIAELTRANSLFLSAAAENNHRELSSVYRWFSSSLTTVTASQKAGTTLLWYEHARYRGRIAELLAFADLGVIGVEVEPTVLTPELAELAATFFSDEAQKEFSDRIASEKEPRLVHRAGGEPRAFAPHLESSGTWAWFSLIGPVVQALEVGLTVIADELDAYLHPHLVSKLVELFQNPQTNRSGAQLLFNGHGTHVLGPGSEGRLKRDQIWFTEKGRDGATRLYPLLEYRVRQDLDNIEKKYLAGRFGAVPFLDDSLLESLAAEG